MLSPTHSVHNMYLFIEKGITYVNVAHGTLLILQFQLHTLYSVCMENVSRNAMTCLKQCYAALLPVAVT